MDRFHNQYPQGHIQTTFLPHLQLSCWLSSKQPNARINAAVREQQSTKEWWSMKMIQSPLALNELLGGGIIFRNRYGFM